MKPKLIMKKGKDRYRYQLGLFECEICQKRWVTRMQAIENNTSTGCNCTEGENQNNKHGLRYTSEHNIWTAIKQRCSNTNSSSYEDYGCRGIKICQLWEYSFEEFYKDMGPRPSKKHSVHRIDNENGYFPNNCKWATTKEQARCKRNNTFLTFNGETHCIKEWSEITGINYGTINTMLGRGHSVEAIFKKHGYLG